MRVFISMALVLFMASITTYSQSHPISKKDHIQNNPPSNNARHLHITSKNKSLWLAIHVTERNFVQLQCIGYGGKLIKTNLNSKSTRDMVKILETTSSKTFNITPDDGNTTIILRRNFNYEVELTITDNVSREMIHGLVDEKSSDQLTNFLSGLSI